MAENNANNSFGINEETFKAYSEVIAKQVEVNVKILNEMQEINKNIEKSVISIEEISQKLSNGLLDKVNKLHTDISDKNGYLPKHINAIKYIWVPIIIAAATAVLGVIQDILR